MIKIFNLNIFIRDFSLTVKRETFNLKGTPAQGLEKPRAGLWAGRLGGLAWPCTRACTVLAQPITRHLLL